MFYCTYRHFWHSRRNSPSWLLYTILAIPKRCHGDTKRCHGAVSTYWLQLHFIPWCLYFTAILGRVVRWLLCSLDMILPAPCFTAWWAVLRFLQTQRFAPGTESFAAITKKNLSKCWLTFGLLGKTFIYFLIPKPLLSTQKLSFVERLQFLRSSPSTSWLLLCLRLFLFFELTIEIRNDERS